MWGEVEIVRSARSTNRLPPPPRDGGGVWCQVLAQLFAQRPSLGAPRRLSTPMPRPFAHVCQPPTPGTPAAAAGLALGDAIVRMGPAEHLRDVQSALMANVGLELDVVVVDTYGQLLLKTIVPVPWDKSAPNSLLGCQMSNQLPAHHPAVQEPSLCNGKPMPASAARVKFGRAAPAPSGSRCWQRFLLALTALLQLALVLVLVGLPSVSPGASALWRLASFECAAPGGAKAAKPSHDGLRSVREIGRASCRERV